MKKVFFLVAIVIGFLGCDDLIEVEDISNRTVPVFAPLEGAVLTTNSVGFNWDSVEDATAYRFQLVQPNFDNAQQLLVDNFIEADSIGSIATSFNENLVNGNYTWRIKALNSAFETEYTTNAFQVEGDANADIISPNTPILVAPINGTSQDETQVEFSWTREDIPGTAERDSIFFFQEEALSTLISAALGANKTFTATLSSGTFYWVVRAYDAAGNESDNSEVFTITIN